MELDLFLENNMMKKINTGVRVEIMWKINYVNENKLWKYTKYCIELINILSNDNILIFKRKAYIYKKMLNRRITINNISVFDKGERKSQISVKKPFDKKDMLYLILSSNISLSYFLTTDIINLICESRQGTITEI